MLTKVLRSWAVLDDGGGRRLFTKAYRNDVMLEYEKAQRIYTASLKSRHFLAPRPLCVVEDYSLIVWEYLPGLVNLRQFLLETRHPANIARGLHQTVLQSCGHALATIHLCLDPKHDVEQHLPDTTFETRFPDLSLHVKEVLKRAPVRPLHGDFGCANICVSCKEGEVPRVVVFDPSPNAFQYRQAQSSLTGSIYFDLSLLIASLNSNPTFYFRYSKDTLFLAEEFLHGYEQEASCAVDKCTALACAADVLFRYSAYQEKQIARGRLGALWLRKFRSWRARQLLRAANASR
jgi:hypothetical protein